MDGHAPPQPHRRPRPAAARAGGRARCTSRARSTPRATSGCCASGPTVRERVRAAADRAAPTEAARARARRAPWRPTDRRAPTRRSRSPATSSPGALPGSRCSRCWRPRAGGPDDALTASTTCWPAVAERSGLPLTMLDERERLDVDALRRFFGAARDRPAGGGRRAWSSGRAAQGGADRSRRARRPCCCSSARPGTGKTEIAKALAEYLFGSPRPDDPARHERVPERRAARGGCSATASREDASLVAARSARQPFSVVLLDEFEKADPGVWDLFLQVFDDGRLSDPRGEPADFRHAVIIMTSNLGAKIPTGAGIGFSPAPRVRRRQRRAGGDARRSGASSSTGSTARSCSGRCHAR